MKKRFLGVVSAIVVVLFLFLCSKIWQGEAKAQPKIRLIEELAFRLGHSVKFTRNPRVTALHRTYALPSTRIRWLLTGHIDSPEDVQDVIQCATQLGELDYVVVPNDTDEQFLKELNGKVKCIPERNVHTTDSNAYEVIESRE